MFLTIFNFCPRWMPLLPSTIKYVISFSRWFRRLLLQGSNFFSQTLTCDEKYFCCPPVNLIVPCFKRLCTVSGVQAVLLVPAWAGHAFWPFLFNGSGRQPQIKDVFRFHTGFVFANEATSTVFSRNPRFDMLALLVVV